MSLQDAAAQLIDDVGISATLRKVTEGSYDTDTGTVPGGSTSDLTVQALLLNYSDFQRANTSIDARDRKAVIKAKDLASPPDQQDILIVGSVEFEIISVQEVQEAGSSVIYTCQVRA